LHEPPDLVTRQVKDDGQASHAGPALEEEGAGDREEATEEAGWDETAGVEEVGGQM
jgi:hypothetical protein